MRRYRQTASRAGREATRANGPTGAIPGRGAVGNLKRSRKSENAEGLGWHGKTAAQAAPYEDGTLVMSKTAGDTEIAPFFIRLQAAALVLRRRQLGMSVPQEQYDAARKLVKRAKPRDIRRLRIVLNRHASSDNQNQNISVNEVDVGSRETLLSGSPAPSGATIEYLKPTLRVLGMNQRAMGTNPRAQGTNPRALRRAKPEATIPVPSGSDDHHLQRVVATYNGSDGDATVKLYADLGSAPIAVVATNLFRAQKNSARAKVYRGGNTHGSYKAQAYARKEWAISNLATVLIEHAQVCDISWGWGIDENETYARHVLYVELPQDGQVSFHTPARGHGPSFAGQWDGARGMSPERTCRFVARVLADRG